MRAPAVLAGLLTGAALAGGALTLPAHAARVGDLVLTPPTLAGGGVRLVATVPPALSDRELPAGAFAARQGGRDVPLSVTRVVPGAVDLVIAIDTAGEATALTAEQSAAADLLRTLPATTPTTVLPGAVRTTAREALGVVGGLRLGSGGLLDGLPEADTGRRLVVVMAGCPALAGESRSVPGDDVQVTVLGLGGDCGVSAARLAGRSPGLVRTGLDTARLLASVDETRRSLLGQYALTAAGPVGDGPLEVSVRDSGTTATATAALPDDLSSPGTDTLEGGGDPPAWAVAVAVALAALTAGGLGAELLARRRTAPA